MAFGYVQLERLLFGQEMIALVHSNRASHILLLKHGDVMLFIFIIILARGKLKCL